MLASVPGQTAELLWPIDRQGLPEHGIDLTEDRGAGANPDCERENRGCREARRLAHETEGEGEILAQAFDPCGAPGLPDVFLDHHDRAEFSRRRRACLGWRQARSDPVFRFEIDVIAELLVEIVFPVHVSPRWCPTPAT